MTTTQKVFIAIALIAVGIAGKSALDYNNRARINSETAAMAELIAMPKKMADKTAEIEKQKRSDIDLNKLISNRVFEPVSRASYPATAEKLGLAFNRTQQFRETAARYALRKSNCDYVEWSELDDNSTQDNLAVNLKCKNGIEEFNISEFDILNTNNPVSIENKSIPKENAIQACTQLAKAQIPGENTLLILDSQHTITKNTARSTTYLKIEAKSGFKTALTYSVFCDFWPNQAPTIKIKLI